MKILSRSKEGGPKSRVWGYFLVEWKGLFSVALLHFKDGTRPAYHSHAFHALSWVLWGKLTERVRNWDTYRQEKTNTYRASLLPIFTSRRRLHQVESSKNTWVLTFRGPWSKYWYEVTEDDLVVRLTHGRKPA